MFLVKKRAYAWELHTGKKRSDSRAASKGAGTGVGGRIKLR